MQAVAQAENASSGADRAGFLAIALTAAGVLATALWLAPDARGFGSHEQLGLPPCAFRVVTTLPCPGCGLTTAFAYMVRGQLLLALRANPAGAMLCVMTMLALPISLWASARSWSMSDTCVRLRIPSLVLALTTLGFAQWLIRLAIIAFG